MGLLSSIDDCLQAIADMNELSRALVTIASACGLLILLYYFISLTLRLVQGFRLYVLSQHCCRTNFAEKYGRWAVISGGSDGIGLEFARELARAGMSIVVISRSAEKLAIRKLELEREENVGKVETIQADLADSSLENFDRIRAQLKPDERDIGVLINNVGTAPYGFARYDQFNIGTIIKMLNLNVGAMLHLTRMVLPGMLQRERGLVVNVSSTSGLITAPFWSVYALTKSFVILFTRQLQQEYHWQPIRITSLIPGPVHTNLYNSSDLRGYLGPGFLWPKAGAYAKSTVNALSVGADSFAGVPAHGLLNFGAHLAETLGLAALIPKLLMTERAGGGKTDSGELDRQRETPEDGRLHVSLLGSRKSKSKQVPRP